MEVDIVAESACGRVVLVEVKKKKVKTSFPTSGWECLPRRSASDNSCNAEPQNRHSKLEVKNKENGTTPSVVAGIPNRRLGTRITPSVVAGIPNRRLGTRIISRF
jgi:hypothetical protein